MLRLLAALALRENQQKPALNIELVGVLRPERGNCGLASIYHPVEVGTLNLRIPKPGVTH